MTSHLQKWRTTWTGRRQWKRCDLERDRRKWQEWAGWMVKVMKREEEKALSHGQGVRPWLLWKDRDDRREVCVYIYRCLYIQER